MRRRGFTLIEAVVAIALLAIGITATIGALGSLTKAEVGVMEREKLHRLAIEKHQELVATGDYATGALEGEFAGFGRDGYQWEAAYGPTGIEGVNRLTVQTSRTQSGQGPSGSADGLIYVPPQDTAGEAP